MEQIPGVRTGVWRDYDQSFFQSYLCTVNSSASTVLQLAIGILFASASPYLSRIIIRCIYEWPRCWLVRRRNQGPYSADPDNEAARLLGNDNEPAVQGKTRAFTYVTVVLVIAIVTSVGYSVAGSRLSEIPAGSSALANSTVCGWWHLRSNASAVQEIEDELLQAKKEYRAGEYARDCYGDGRSPSPNHCDFFERQNIHFDTERGKKCGFRDTSLCYGGEYAAVEMSTGMVDSNIIGVNGAKRPKMLRRTRCVPLDMNHRLVVTEDERSHNYTYYLGPKHDSNYSSPFTFRQTGDPFTWDMPAYSVNAYEAGPDKETRYWRPVPELGQPNNTHMTVIFISSCHIFYRGYSEDPLFPAKQKVPEFGDNSWINDDPRARPLVCTDWSKVCSHDGHCAPVSEPSAERDPRYEFVRLALQNSTTFDAIQYRLGHALLAHHMIADYDSAMLPPNHWIDEAKALFRTSLARIQYDALDIATAAGRGRGDKYVDGNPELAPDKLCGIFKIQLPKGYTNVNLWATGGVLAAALPIVILGIQSSQPLRTEQKLFFHPTYLVIDLCALTIFRVVRKGTNRTRNYLGRMKGKLFSVIAEKVLRRRGESGRIGTNGAV